VEKIKKHKIKKILHKLDLKSHIKGKMDEIALIGATALGWEIDSNGNIRRPTNQTPEQKEKEKKLLKRAEKVLGKRKIKKLKQIIKEEKPDLVDEVTEEAMKDD